MILYIKILYGFKPNRVFSHKKSLIFFANIMVSTEMNDITIILCNNYYIIIYNIRIMLYDHSFVEMFTYYLTSWYHRRMTLL